MTRNLRTVGEPRVLKEKHLKLYLIGAQGGKPIETVWWNCIDEKGQTPDVTSGIEVAYTIETNTWNDEVRMQLNVVDIRVAEGQLVGA